MMMLFFSLEDLLQVTLLTNSECNRVEENRSYYYLWREDEARCLHREEIMIRCSYLTNQSTEYRD